ncbi:MAG: NAD-dependent epimerase/dehydratase family protein [Clostridiales bacterium]|nr:NAD-dependent epimerase/dehydratase family protein [Clostridiales bacterium]
MDIYENKLYKDGIKKVLPSFIKKEKLFGKSVLITGATGLICSAIVDVIRYLNETENAQITAYVCGRSEQKAVDRFGKNEYVKFVYYDALKSVDIREKADYIICGASVSSPKMFAENPVQTMLSNIDGVRNLLDYAKENNSERLLYISSSEVYGRKESMQPFSENDLGYVDLLSPRSSYPMAKRACETLCVAYTTQYGVDTVIARPGHIYGPTATPNDTRVSSVFAYLSAKGDDIEMKGDGKQLRSYCHCLDCATAILTILTCGEKAKAYNVSNPNSIIDIMQMTEITAKAGGVVVKKAVVSENDKRIFNPMDNSSLSSTLLESLGWQGVISAEEGLIDTVKILKEKL